MALATGAWPDTTCYAYCTLNNGVDATGKRWDVRGQPATTLIPSGTKLFKSNISLKKNRYGEFDHNIALIRSGHDMYQRSAIPVCRSIPIQIPPAQRAKVNTQYQYQYSRVLEVNTQYQYQYFFCPKVNTDINTNTGPKSYTSTLLPSLCY